MLNALLDALAQQLVTAIVVTEGVRTAMGSTGKVAAGVEPVVIANTSSVPPERVQIQFPWPTGGTRPAM